jgi:pantoate--beta-alanine ligase
MDSPSSLSVFTTIQEMQRTSEKLRLEKKRIAVIPTMGSLHNGHANLIEYARSLADVVITTIFVNPTQFGPMEDFTRYPRDFDRDQAIAAAAGTDIIFHPDTAEMYPAGFQSLVEVEGVSNILEGAFRPKHFRGVATVVAKLFHITKPHVAVFGQKDAQQAFIIRTMVQDLNFDVNIVLAPIIRESDGLAMSSRNVYLDEHERKNALVLSHSLNHAAERIRRGERSVDILKKEMMERIQSGSPTQIDYIAFVNPTDFSEINSLESPEVLILLAVRFGTTRLIDNIMIPIIR